MVNADIRRPEHGEPPSPTAPAWPSASLLTQELTPRVQEVWNSMLGLDLQSSDQSLPSTTPGVNRWSGCIALSGETRGAVTVSCMEPMAKLAAAAMFGMDAADTTAAEIQDAIGELANIVGGQTKAVLGGACTLGLPMVVEGESFEATVPHSHSVVVLHFLCEGHPVEVAIVGADTER